MLLAFKNMASESEAAWHEQVSADDTDMIHAETAKKRQAKQRALFRLRRSCCRYISTNSNGISASGSFASPSASPAAMRTRAALSATAVRSSAG